MALKTTAGTHGEAHKGRGAPANPEGRFEKEQRESTDDGWFQPPEEEPARPKTTITIERAKSIVSRHDSPDLNFSQSINPYRGCEHGCSYCVGGDTPILMADSRIRALSELRAGDEIYGTRRIGAYLRYVRTRVLDHWSVIKPAYRVTLEDGTSLVTSGDHRFLSDRGWKYVTGAEQGRERRPHLTINNKLMGVGGFADEPRQNDDYRRGYLCGMIRGDGLLKSYEYSRRPRVDRIHTFRLALTDPEALLRTQDYLLDCGIATYEFQFLAAAGNQRAMHAIRTSSSSNVDSIRELIQWPSLETREWMAGFLAGVFDAEGSYSNGVIRISNTNSAIIDCIERSLRAYGFTSVLERTKLDRVKPIDVVRVRGGLREHLRFFHSVAPAITRKMDISGQAVKSNARLGIVSIEPLGGAMRLYDITTETEDFIANGVISHNCYARPSHAYVGLSPGLDFETRLFSKPNAAELLREEISKPGYHCEPVMIGANTDGYQPIEKTERITRSILEVLAECHHPVAIITKSAMVERDLDILAPMASEGLAHVVLSVTSLDNNLSSRMEPRASAPARRIQAIARLSAAGVPVGVNVAPVIPFLTDSEVENILDAAAAAGATSAGYTIVRLPWEVLDIFKAWLEEHYPLKAAHVMSRIRDMRDGRENDPNFGSRMHGTGEFSELLSQRFRKACKRLGLAHRHREGPQLDTAKFLPPGNRDQLKLF